MNWQLNETGKPGKKDEWGFGKFKSPEPLWGKDAIELNGGSKPL